MIEKTLFKNYGFIFKYLGDVEKYTKSSTVIYHRTTGSSSHLNKGRSRREMK